MVIPEEKKRRKQSLFKEIVADNFHIWERNWVYKSMKLREHLIISMQNDLIQETILKFSKFNDTEF